MRNHRRFWFVVLLVSAGTPVLPALAQTIATSSPANNSEVLSPVHYVASATSPNCPQGISGMRIYIAPRVVGYKIQASSIDTKLDLSAGTYKTTVQAWDRCGNVTKRALNITVLPKGLKPVRFVYVADGFAKIWGYSANPLSGDLSPTAQGPVVVNDRLAALAGDTGGYRLYGTFADTTIPRGGIYAYFIDRRNGHLDAVPGSPFSTAPWGSGAIAVHPSGKFVFVATHSADFKHGILSFGVSSDGSLSMIGTDPIPTSSSVTSLVPDRWGRYLYALTAVPGSIEAYAVDQSSGDLTPISGSPYPISTGPIYPYPQGLVDLNGRFLYASLFLPVLAQSNYGFRHHWQVRHPDGTSKLSIPVSD